MPVFDNFAQEYDEILAETVKSSGFKPDYFHEYKLQEVLDYIKTTELINSRIKLLNFGCGTGGSEKYIKKYLPNTVVFSTDVSAESVNIAREKNKELDNITFEPFDGINIPFEEKFDIIFVANVFHHINRKNHKEVLKNIYNRLGDNGILFIFELNPLNPCTMWLAINNDYKFDKDAKLLHPFYADKILKEAGFKWRKRRYKIFFPGFLSSLIPFEKHLYWFSLGAHYYYIARKAVKSHSYCHCEE